jgi:ADP-heptose:LPS heptosyltransferase
MNTNYHEWTAEIAEVPFKPCKLFYPTSLETFNAGELIDQASFNILWALSGSSLHKFYPHQDAVIARILLEMPEARIFLVGDEACRLLEQGWENDPRVTLLSGKMQIRETLTLAGIVDLVVGPETGVLNAVGMEKNPHKVIFLSHSSANNLTKYWVNVQALTPVSCPCHPCHQLHYTAELCSQDAETGAALCAQDIPPYKVYDAIEKVYKNWKREAL